MGDAGPVASVSSGAGPAGHGVLSSRTPGAELSRLPAAARGPWGG